MPNYKATCTSEQLAMISTACEIYARLMMGQFNTIMHNVLSHLDIPTERYLEIQELLETAGKKVWYGTGGSPGLRNPVLPDAARVAWDIHWVIRHLLAYTNNPEGGHSVVFDKPSQSSKQPLMEVIPTDDTPDPRPVQERMRDELVEVLQVPPKDFEQALSKIREWKEFYEQHH